MLSQWVIPYSGLNQERRRHSRAPRHPGGPRLPCLRVQDNLIDVQPGEDAIDLEVLWHMKCQMFNHWRETAREDEPCMIERGWRWPDSDRSFGFSETAEASRQRKTLGGLWDEENTWKRNSIVDSERSERRGSYVG